MGDEVIDLVGPTRGAVFRALLAGVSSDLCAVFDDIPQGTEPNYLKIGAIDTEQDDTKVDQFEIITVEVFGVYRGADRGVLVDMMFAGRKALDRVSLPPAGGAQFVRSRFIKGVISDASPQDGVTYAGLMHFEIWAEPA